jgi:hypothetical protein
MRMHELEIIFLFIRLLADKLHKKRATAETLVYGKVLK